MAPEMKGALTERHALIEARADAVLDRALIEREDWATTLGAQPEDEKTGAAWHRQTRVVAAYRDRYGITGTAPLGATAESDAQRIDAARARAALGRAQDLAQRSTGDKKHSPRAARAATGPVL